MCFRKLTLTTLIGIMLFATAVAAEEVAIITGEWAPFISKKLPGYGPHSKIVVAAFKAVGVESKIKFVPWKRAVKELREGHSTCSYSWSMTDNRKKFATYSTPIVTSKTIFIFLKSKNPDFVYTTLDALKPYKVAGLAGYAHVDKFKKAKLNVEINKNLSTALKKILLGRIDLVCDNETVAIDMIKREFSEDKDKLGISKKTFETKESYVVFSKKAPNSDKYREKFDIGLAKIKADGTYDAIIAKLK